MEFSLFLKNIPKIVKEILPATDAHLKMVPPERIDFVQKQGFLNTIPKKQQY